MKKYKIKHYFEYIGLILIKFLILHLPLSIVYRLAEFVGLLMYYFVPIRKKMMKKNILRIFQNISEKEINAILKNSYLKISKSAFEYFFMPLMNSKNIDKFGIIENRHIIDEALKNKKGAILLGAHFDNPELVTNVLKLNGYPMFALVKKQQNPFTHRMIEKMRTAHGIEILYKGGSIKKIFQNLKNNYALATVADIWVSEDEGRIIDFCGIPTPTPIAPAVLANRLGSAVIPVFSCRLADNSHKILVYDRIDVCPENISDNEKIIMIMRKYNILLEENIRKFPDEWFWMHNRWKDK